MNIEYIQYTIKHKRAFLEVEKQLTGRISLRGLFHDLDKIIMYLFLSKETTTKIHRKWSRHHDRARTQKDYEQIMIDWECARITKPDKPLNAYEFLFYYAIELKEKLLPLLIKYDLARTSNGEVLH